MTLTIYPWKFTNKVLQLKDAPCFGLRFYNFLFVEEKNRDCAEEIMNEECLICKAPLTYLEADMLMECEIFVNLM